MNLLTNHIKTFFEYFAFGVCDWLGQYLRIPGSRIRMFFIYTSFVALGSPLVFYLILAFLLNFKKMIWRNRGSIWDM